jgi:hypothetical protein
MSEQGRDIQNQVRQELQRRIREKMGTVEADDSIELETRRMPGKVGIKSGHKLALGKQIFKNAIKGKVIPVKSASPSNLSGLGTNSDDSPSVSLPMPARSPAFTAEGPSIRLVPNNAPTLPKDKKIPMKHDPKRTGHRALVIPAAKPPSKPIRNTRKPSARAAQLQINKSPSKMQLSPYKTATFTMGSIPADSKRTGRRKSQRNIPKTVIPPAAKPRWTRPISSARMGKGLTIRDVQVGNVDVQVPVKFDGRNSKRKYADAESSPSKRAKLNQVGRRWWR